MKIRHKPIPFIEIC